MTSTDVLFEPVEIGPLTLRSRFWMPPHGGAIGAAFGRDDRLARKNAAYWGSRAADGVGMVCGLQGFIDNQILIPGFEPTGLGARVVGTFRADNFAERASLYVEAVKAGGAHAGIQLIQQGATPHSPSGVLANYANNQVPHVLTRSEIGWFLEEYAYSAGQAAAVGLDAIEVHANHEDLMQLFLSPATNLREDEYGGDLAGRTRLLREVLAAMREQMTDGMALGVRLNMDELFEGGYDAEGGLAIARLLVDTGHIDYLHCVMGNNWGAPSYIQPHHYDVAAWARMAGDFRRALDVPVVYTGRVSSPQAAAQVVADGHADAVGMARAMFAEPELVSKTRSGRTDELRPCIGTNDCLHRGVVEGLAFGCSVNPRTGREDEAPLPPADPPRQVLVVGGGPAGLEVAALLAERGHRVGLWERSAALGGQVRVAAAARENASYASFLRFQENRLQDAKVTVELGREATAEAVRQSGAEVVVIATGARPRRPPLPGFDAPGVVEGRDVLTGAASVGRRVAVVAMEDHLQPLTVAGHLVDLGSEVTVFYATPGIAPLVGKYSIGAPLAKLAAGGAQVRVMERAARIADGTVVTRNTYAGTESAHEGFDTVVLACGGEAESSLFDELQGQGGLEVHVLGDAYAPRRISFATRQAYELALRI